MAMITVQVWDATENKRQEIEMSNDVSVEIKKLGILVILFGFGLFVGCSKPSEASEESHKAAKAGIIAAEINREVAEADQEAVKEHIAVASDKSSEVSETRPVHKEDLPAEAGADVVPLPHDWVYKCRLVSIRIPANSPHRGNENISHPPNLYVVIKRNGEQLGKASSAALGWEVDFLQSDARNIWQIPEGAKDRYSLEIWDDNWGWDNLVLSIIDLNRNDFRKEIYETNSRFSKERLIQIRFEEK